MRLSIFFTVSLLGLLPLTGFGHENSPYVEVGLGYAIATGELEHSGVNAAGMPIYGQGDASVRSFAVGYQMISGWRLELDFRNRRVDIGDAQSLATRPSVQALVGSDTERFEAGGTTESQTRMLNVAYVGRLKDPDWTAYLKVGAGESKNRSQATLTIDPTVQALNLDSPLVYPRGSEREFAWSAGLGVHMELSERAELGLDYQYSNLGDAATLAGPLGDILEHDELAVHEVSVRLRYHF